MRLRARLNAARNRHLDNIRHAQSFDDFQQRIGKVMGLEEAVNECDEMEKEMGQGR